jgi:hypothetical protein
MPSWLSDFLSTVAVVAICVVVVAGISRFLDWSGYRKRPVDRQVGKPATFDASLRANRAPYPRRWRAGWLTVNSGPPTWKPRFSLLRRPVVLPASAAVEQIRDVAGLREAFSVNPVCRVILARAGDVNLELAVFPTDVPIARQALESGPTGGSLRPAGSGANHLDVGRVAEVVLEVVDAQDPRSVDMGSVTISGESTAVEIVLIPHRQLGGFSLGVWADERHIGLFWAAVIDLSTHDEIDLGVTTANIPWTGDWAGALRRSIADELARPITVDVRRGLLGPKLTCSVSVDGKVKTFLVGRAPEAHGGRDTTTLMSSKPLAIGLPVPLDNWWRWA